MNVLVSGSSGFIGGYVVQELLARGHSVVGVDNFSKYGKVAKSYDDHPDYRLVLGNVEDEIRQFTTQTPITDDEFDRAVKSLKVEFAETSETASGIAEALGESFTLTHHFDSYSDYLNVLSQVSRQDVERAAHRWLVVDQHYTAVMVPEA